MSKTQTARLCRSISPERKSARKPWREELGDASRPEPRKSAGVAGAKPGQRDPGHTASPLGVSREGTETRPRTVPATASARTRSGNKAKSAASCGWSAVA